jgi:hypothetical protein
MGIITGAEVAVNYSQLFLSGMGVFASILQHENNSHYLSIRFVLNWMSIDRTELRDWAPAHPACLPAKSLPPTACIIWPRRHFGYSALDLAALTQPARFRSTRLPNCNVISVIPDIFREGKFS